MMHYLNEMIWFPAAFLAGNISFEPVDDSSVRVTLTGQGRTATGTLFLGKEGRLTGFVAKRYRTPPAATRSRGPPRSPATASSRAEAARTRQGGLQTAWRGLRLHRRHRHQPAR